MPRPIKHRGSIILVAIGTLTLLGMMALSTNYQAVISARRSITKILRAEGYYNGELSVWNSYFRQKSNLALKTTADSQGRYPASFEAKVSEGLPETLVKDVYNPLEYGEGAPLGIKATLDFDPNALVIRHFASDMLRVKPQDAAGTYCGSSVYANRKKDFRTCIWAPGAPPPPSLGGRRLAVGKGFGCFVRKNSSVKCWGANWSNALLNPSVKGNSYVPLPALSLTSGVSQIFTGHGTVCALVDGIVKCWGSNAAYLIKPEYSMSVAEPTILSGLQGKFMDLDISISTSAPLNMNWHSVPGTGGGAFACAVIDGVVKCWGNRGYTAEGLWAREFDNHSETPKDLNTPIAVPGFPTSATSISIGRPKACATTADGVWCWNRLYSALDSSGIPYQEVERPTPHKMPGLSPKTTAISVGMDHACAIDNGRVKCWGKNDFAQLGVSQTALTKSDMPVLVEGITQATQVSVGEKISCVINSASELLCWGKTRTTLGTTHIPTKIPNAPPRVLEVHSEINGACVYDNEDNIYCWGNALASQGLGSSSGDTTATEALRTRSLEDPEIYKDYLPQGKDFKDLKKVAQIAAGTNHTCALLEDGTLRCWGGNGSGQLGNNSIVDSRIPVRMEGLSAVSAISCGDGFSCVIVGGQVKCWGSNDFGQLGNNSKTSSLVPVTVTALTDVSDIALGDRHACAISKGSVKCWGANGDTVVTNVGRLGNNTKEGSPVPVQVEGIAAGATSVCTGAHHSCAVVAGSAKCWGGNIHGQLGNNANTDSLIPVQVEGLTSNVTSVFCGDAHNCAIHGGGAKCWGWNATGQLGNNSGSNSSVPVQVEGLSKDVVYMEAGNTHSCAIVSGQVKCWGGWDGGQLGLNDTTDLNTKTPQNVLFLPAGATKLALGAFHSCTLIDGAIYCWGNDSSGAVTNRPEIVKNSGLVVHVPVLVALVD